MSPDREVAMRPPEVFVRELAPGEGMQLRSISRRAEYQSKRERAMIVLASATGRPVPQTAELVGTDDSHVRKVIHAFNEESFGSLDPEYRGGRPPKTAPAERDSIVVTVRARPDSHGFALTRWSLPGMREHLIEAGIVEELGTEILREAGLSHQRTRSWKQSPDPDFQEKAERLLSLYREPPPGGPVSHSTRWPDPADPPPGLGMGTGEAARAPAGHLQPQGRCALPLRRLRRRRRSPPRPASPAQGTRRGDRLSTTRAVGSRSRLHPQVTVVGADEYDLDGDGVDASSGRAHIVAQAAQYGPAHRIPLAREPGEPYTLGSLSDRNLVLVIKHLQNFQTS